MDQIISARVDDKIVKRINHLAEKTGASKKSIIEKAILLLSRKIESEKGTDIFDQTFGAWQRKESAQKTVSRIRAAFRESMHRYE